MGVLKWCGYILAAIVVLTVIAGAGLFIAAVVIVGGIALAVIGLIFLVAGIIRSAVEQ